MTELRQKHHYFRLNILKDNISKNLFSSSKNIKEKVKKAKKESSRRWIVRQINDPYVNEAHKRGYRSRSAFKLLQINKKYSIIRPGSAILDLGCAPGGWLQVIKELNKSNKSNLLIGIDLLVTDDIPGVNLIKGDFRDEKIKLKLESILKGRKLDGILSDMAANTTGHRSTDHLRTNALIEEALEFSLDYFKDGAFFLSKCFKGGAQIEILKILKNKFKYVKHVKPDASRKESVESYVLALEYKNN